MSAQHQQDAHHRGPAAIRWAPPGTASASTSRCSPPTRPRSSCACSTTTARPSSSASSCPSTPTRSGTATCRTRGPARSTATASTAPTSREAGHRFNPNKLLLDPYAKAHVGELQLGPGGVRLHARRRERRPDLRRARQRAASCRNAGSSTRPSPGARDRAPRVPWERTIFYETHVRGFTKLHPARARGAARHLRRPRAARRWSTTSAASASPRSSCCRSTPSSTTATCSRRA